MTEEEEFKAIMNGEYTSKVMSDEDKAAYESEEESDEIDDEIADEAESENEDGEESLEETEAEDEEATDVDTEQDEVAQTEENAEGEESEGSEDTQPDEVVEGEDEAKEDEPEAKSDTDDYKAKYEQLLSEHEAVKAFQEKVTSDFKANKKTVKGITDPDKILQAVQKSVGLSDKLEGYKKIKPYMKPLEERGLLQDTAKFDMLMKLADGDNEALKYYLKQNNVDPLEIDLDSDIQYDSSTTIENEVEMQYKEAREIADVYSVGDRFTDVTLKEWDSDSMYKIISNPEYTEQLAMQLQNGVFDEVSADVENMKLTVPGFSGKSSLDQYNEASQIRNARVMKQMQATQQQQAPVVEEPKTTEPVVDKVAEEQARLDAIKAEIAEMEKKKAYAAKVAEKEKKAAEARDKASAVSNTRKSTSSSTKVAEPEFNAEYFRSLMRK